MRDHGKVSAGLPPDGQGYPLQVPPRRAEIPAIPLVRTDDGQPTVSDRYELRSVLGSGGMGTVWEAYDQRLGRLVALKVLRDDLPPGAAERLEREARAAARIADARVVTVLDLDRTRDGTPYLVLECHDSATLADELRDTGALPQARLDRLIDDLLGALGAAHACGVLHRDVKPANVLSSPSGFRVTDFGLASLDDDQSTETDLMGTLVYVAPERLDGARGSTRSDVFSAAVVLYEAASGHQPFRGDDPLESMAKLRQGNADPLPEHLPLPFRVAIHRALAADPDERPADADELLAAIRADVGPGADPTVALDATALLPRPTAAPAAPPPVAAPAPGPEPVVPAASIGEPAPAAEVDPGRSLIVPAPAAPEPGSVPEPATSAPPRPPQPSVGEHLEPMLAAARRRPELVIGAVAALLLVVLFVVVALASGGSGDPAEAPPADAPAAEQPATLDEVLERIEELGG